ncbi:PAS domain S-box protein [Pseudanabaena sp. FACHB-2040]|uniref:PAS domain S-box protein n=1 Tax=Pseudanabaena sp. FACHB-2040 TaxID=2692859 RepID=UPI0016856209|nr:PAS domain S-box protein [Pseudanabaena sp. FACHB-2040]MBD2258318.1 PAS domain S-box protein [Pseudanabaena sp. FACHB-2040]
MKRDATGKFVTNWGSETKQRVSLSLTHTAWQSLDQEARRRGISRSEVIEQFARSLTDEPVTLNHNEAGVSHDIDIIRQALETEHAWFESVLQQIPAGVMIADAAGKLVLINEQAKALVGYEYGPSLQLEDYSSVIPFELLRADGQSYTADEYPLVRSLRSGTVITNEEMEIHCSDGSRVFINISSAPIRDQQGQVVAAAAILQDVTQRKLMEQALQKSESRLRGLFDASPIGIIIGDFQGHILEVNDAWLNILGYPREEVVSGQVNFLDITPPEHLHLDQQAMAEMKATGSHTPYEKEYIRKDGSRIPVLVGTAYLGGPSDLGIGFLVDLSDRKHLELELQQQEQQFKLVVENAPDIISRMDCGFRHLYVSPSIEQATGIPSEQFIGKTNADLGMPEAICSAWVTALKQVFETGQEQTIEFNFPTPEGERWYQSRIFPEFAVNGSVKTVLNIARDVTDYKQAEAAQAQARQQIEQLLTELQQKERQQQFLIDLNDAIRALQDSQDIIWHIVCATGQYFNVTRCTYGDIDPQQEYVIVERDFCSGVISVVGKHLLNAFGPESIAELKQGKTLVIEDVDRDPRTANAAPAFNAIQTKSLLCVPLVKAGRFVAVLVLHHVVPRLWTAEEAALVERIAEKAWLAIERARAERALCASQDRLQLALIVGRMGTWDWNLETDQITWSEGHYTILGLQPHECEPSYELWSQSVHPDDLAATEATLRMAMLERTEYAHEHRVLWPDGSTYWIEARGQFTYSADGRPTRMIGILIDVTERKQAEQEREQLLERERSARSQAEAANRIKDEFLAVLSHELRSPLNPILGWVKMLRQKQLDAVKIQYALETIERNAKLQAQLIEDLLDVSRILQGKMTLNVGPVNLVDTVEAALETVRLAAEAKQIAVIIDLQDSRQETSNGQPLTTTGDSNRLQQVVWNLLSNAVKFTPAGGRVEVRLTWVGGQGLIASGHEPHPSSSQDKGQITPAPFVQITVSDTGQGIRPDFLPYVFDYFRQEDSTTTRRFGGLGLGLAIVRHLTELHGGTVWAESPGLNLGATFGVRLPLRAAHQEGPADNSPLEEAIDLAGARVLIVDDDSDMRELATFILVQAGATVATATSAAEALTRLSQSVPDLLLCDIGMPDINGYALMQQIRKGLPEHGSTVPAIALTAYAGEVNRHQALAAGFQQHLAKPVDPGELVRAIAHLLGIDAG